MGKRWFGSGGGKEGEGEKGVTVADRLGAQTDGTK